MRGLFSRNLFCIDSENDQWLSGKLKQISIESMTLSIHDPFLWRLFYQKDNPNEEGCNGAKTMIYISEDLEVTPCPIMSLSLGNLKDNSLEEIFLSEKRDLVRRDLSSSPRECDGCSHAKTCKGGCRGRTYVLFNSFEKKDPACIL